MLQPSTLAYVENNTKNQQCQALECIHTSNRCDDTALSNMSISYTAPSQVYVMILAVLLIVGFRRPELPNLSSGCMGEKSGSASQLKACSGV